MYNRNIQSAKNVGRKQNKSGIESVFVLTVFLLFVCALLAAVLTFAKVYKISGGRINNRFNNSSAVSLVMQKLHSYDYSGGISVGEAGGVQTLCLHENIDGEEYITYIYCYENSLYELFAEKAYPFSPDDGNELLPCGGFSAEISGNTISFAIGGTVHSYTLRSTAEKGGA